MKLMDILVFEHINVPYEKREMTLEYINQVTHFILEATIIFIDKIHVFNELFRMG